MFRVRRGTREVGPFAPAAARLTPNHCGLGLPCAGSRSPPKGVATMATSFCIRKFWQWLPGWGFLVVFVYPDSSGQVKMRSRGSPLGPGRVACPAQPAQQAVRDRIAACPNTAEDSRRGRRHPSSSGRAAPRTDRAHEGVCATPCGNLPIARQCHRSAGTGRCLPHEGRRRH